jgi:hypothetical protein
VYATSVFVQYFQSKLESRGVEHTEVHSKNRLVDSHTNARLGWKHLQVKNTLAYFTIVNVLQQKTKTVVLTFTSTLAIIPR